MPPVPGKDAEDGEKPARDLNGVEEDARHADGRDDGVHGADGVRQVGEEAVGAAAGYDGRGADLSLIETGHEHAVRSWSGGQGRGHGEAHDIGKFRRAGDAAERRGERHVPAAAFDDAAEQGAESHKEKEPAEHEGARFQLSERRLRGMPVLCVSGPGSRAAIRSAGGFFPGLGRGLFSALSPVPHAG